MAPSRNQRGTLGAASQTWRNPKRPPELEAYIFATTRRPAKMAATKQTLSSTAAAFRADHRLLKLKWITVHTERRLREGYRPAPILLQLVLQLGRLAKVHGVLVEPAWSRSEPFYRSLGFFSFLNEGKEPDFFIDPQHAFNTIGGLLNTRTVRNGDSPAHHVTVNKLPPHMQAIYRLQHQVWDARHGGPRAEALLFDLSICDLPRKQKAAAGHHAPIAVYGRVSVTVNSGTVEVGEPMYYPAAGSHWPVVRAALLSIGRGMGVDLATAAWRMVHQH